MGLKTQMREEISSNWYRNLLQGSTKHQGKELERRTQHSLVLLLADNQHWPFPIHTDTQSNYIFRLSIRSFFLKLLTRANNNKKPTESYITVNLQQGPLAFRLEKNSIPVATHVTNATGKGNDSETTGAQHQAAVPRWQPHGTCKTAGTQGQVKIGD